MKIQLFIISFGICFLCSITGFSQTKKAEDKIDLDPKLSLKEQLQILNAGKENPAKAKAAHDPKQLAELGDIEKETGSTNWKAEPIVEREDVLPETNNQQISPPTTNEQPVPKDETVDVLNYRNLPSSESQPDSESNGEITNYRNLPKSKDQPDGSDPDKK